MTQMAASPAPEFSRIIIADTVTTTGSTQRITATPAECQALAARFGLVGIATLSATVSLRRVRGEMVRVTGELSADVTQTCVVTLEPVDAHVEDRFSALFAPDHLLPREDEEAGLDLAHLATEEMDDPEAMPGGRIDLGELVSQHLSLALDPYPRKAGASFEDVVEPEEEEGAAAEPDKPNPFAKLAKLKGPN